MKLKKFNAHTDFRRLFRKNEIIIGMSIGFLIATGVIGLNHKTIQVHQAAPEQTMQEKYPPVELYETSERAYTNKEQTKNKKYIEL